MTWLLFNTISNRIAMNPHLKPQLIHVLEASQHFGAKGAEAHWRENFQTVLAYLLCSLTNFSVWVVRDLVYFVHLQICQAVYIIYDPFIVCLLSSFQIFYTL